MSKKKVNITVSSNLYDKYKSEYNFSKIFDEVLMMFLITECSPDSTKEIENDTTSFHANGKQFTVKSNELRKYIQYLMSKSKHNSTNFSLRT